MGNVKIKGVIFDLDGTIADTAGDIAAAVNYTRESYRLPRLDDAVVARQVNHGVRRLIEGCFPPELISSDEKYKSLLEVYLGYYSDHIADKTTVYNGFRATLAQLAANGIKLCVLSNKRDDLTKKLIKAILPEIPFTAVQGAQEGLPLKPNPQSALQLMEKMGITPEETVFCGDSDVDMLTAKNCGATALAVSWGNCTRDKLESAGADFIADSPKEVGFLMNNE